MIALKLLLTVAGVLLMAFAVGIPMYGLWMRIEYARRKARGDETTDKEAAAKPNKIDRRRPLALAAAGCLPLLIAASIVVVPSGMGGVRVSQIRGTLPGTLYPGVHFIAPMVDSVETFDLRDHLFTAGTLEEGAKAGARKNELSVQSLEGLNIGLAVTVRYRLDANKLIECAGAHAPTGGQGTCSSGGGERVERTCSGVHRAGDFLDQARRGTLEGSSHYYAQTGRGWHCGGRGDALRHSVA